MRVHRVIGVRRAMITEEVLLNLSEEASRWVLAERGRFSIVSRKLSPEEKLGLSAYFDPETLAAAGIAEVNQIEEPPFMEKWRSMGIPGLLDFRQMAGITLVDTILVARRFCQGRSSWLSLLFHEMVHVVQYRVLTLPALMRLYIQGWADNSCDYYRIPIEVQAYQLQSEFDRNAPAFSVEERVRRELGLPA